MYPISIREAQPEDAPALLAYLQQIGGESDNLTFGAEGLPFSIQEEAEYLRAIQSDPHSVKLLAISNFQIIGDCTLTGLRRRMSHRAELGMSVSKAYWNQGIGSRLLDRVLAFAKEQGIELLQLEVRTDNLAAVHLYEEFGFRKIGISPRHIKIDEIYADVWIMYLELQDRRTQL